MENQIYHNPTEAIPIVTYIQCLKYVLFLLGLVWFVYPVTGSDYIFCSVSKNGSLSRITSPLQGPDNLG